MTLGVNIDHIATLRQARYSSAPDSPNAEPDLALAAALCERAGAGGITIHLRADRRHIQDRDVRRLRAGKNFGKEWTAYASKTKGFIPAVI